MKNVLLSNRFKSFYWYLGLAVLSTIISSVLANIDILTPYISPAFVMLLTGILQQITKALANVSVGKASGFK